MKKNIYTLIDANVNRAKEGLRVIEDINRFILSKTSAVKKLKSLRHSVDLHVKKISPGSVGLLKHRYSREDVGRSSRNKSEFKRSGVNDILISNFKRVEESFRVLEEMSKLFDPKTAAAFKELRYKTYELEKELIK